MSQPQKVLMVAAENDALPGAKVGGVGDVLRDLPTSIIEGGLAVDCVIPSYGFLSRLPGLIKVGEVRVSFSGAYFTVEVLTLPTTENHPTHYILHHQNFHPQGERVYCDDGEYRPFATDATKYAFFCTALAEALIKDVIPKPDVIHCHDWHAAFLLILIKLDLQYKKLLPITKVFTIHNLALQGIRPIKGDDSSFNEWFPHLKANQTYLHDARYSDCINPMRAAIWIADKIHTVSPSYANEILSPSNPALGRYGGEGLESDLVVQADKGKLIGILNGCDYPGGKSYQPLSKTKFANLMMSTLEGWAAKSHELLSSHWLAEKHINRWYKRKSDEFTVTSVGRLTEQKVRLLQTEVSPAKTALESILEILGGTGNLILLGSGDPMVERFLRETATKSKNFIFLNGYSSELSQEIYNFGDLFLMPSSYEPCGISQMLAMRSGQPCLVNSVGGLKDTVKDKVNGFVFQGECEREQAQALVETLKEAKTLFETDSKAWEMLVKNASAERITWAASARRYIKELYS